MLATHAEFTLLYAPNINSYKRFEPGIFAPPPSRGAWTTAPARCGWSATAGLRVENRVPGGDVNPYLALAAMLAGGLHGIEPGSSWSRRSTGNAYDVRRPRVPRTLREARDLCDELRSPGRRSATTSSTTTSTRAGVELAASTPRSPTGSAIRGFERL